MDADAALSTELHRLRHAIPGVSGAVLADVDGLLIANELPGIEPTHIAALAAAGLGISFRFAETAGHGPLREFVVRAPRGWVACYPAGAYAILTLLAHPETEVSRLHAEAHAAAQRLGLFWESARHPASPTAVAPPADPYAPLAVRTPMATLPTDLWSSRTRGWSTRQR